MKKKIVLFILLESFAFAGVGEMAAKVFPETISALIAIVAFVLFNWLLFRWVTPNIA